MQLFEQPAQICLNTRGRTTPPPALAEQKTELPEHGATAVGTQSSLVGANETQVSENHSKSVRKLRVRQKRAHEPSSKTRWVRMGYKRIQAAGIRVGAPAASSPMVTRAQQTGSAAARQARPAWMRP